MAATNKWSKDFFLDLLERVGSTFLGALLAVVTLTSTTPLDWSDGKAVWAVLGVPTLVSLIKGLLANMANPETGASLITDAPPGPEVGATNILYALGVALLVLAVLLLVLTVLKAFVVSWLAIIVLAVVGVFLMLIAGRGVRL